MKFTVTSKLVNRLTVMEAVTKNGFAVEFVAYDMMLAAESRGTGRIEKVLCCQWKVNG